MRMILAAAAAACVTFAPAARAEAICECVPGRCVRMEAGADTEIAGRLVVLKGAYMLRLVRPTCFKGNGDADDIVAGEDRPRQSLVQLAPEEADLPKLKALVGKRVVLKGDAFGAHTRHYLTGALFRPKEIAPAQ